MRSLGATRCKEGPHPVHNHAAASDAADTVPNQDCSDHPIGSDSNHTGKGRSSTEESTLENQLHISPDGHTQQELVSLRECILNSPDVFAVGSEHGRVDPNIAEHRINTEDHPPIKQASRRVSFALRAKVTKMINNMLAENVVQELASPWASPIVLAQTKQKKIL